MNNYRTLISTIVTLLLVAALGLPLFADPSLYVGFLSLSALGLMITVIHFNHIRLSGLKRTVNSVNGVLLLLFLLTSIPACINADWPPKALERISIILLIIIFWLLSSLHSAEVRFQWLRKICLSLFTMAAVWGSIEFYFIILEQGSFSHQSTYEITAFLSHRNLLGAFFWLTLPMAWLNVKSMKVLRWPYYSILAIGAVLSLLLLSRITWLLAILSVAGFIVYRFRKLNSSFWLTLMAVAVVALSALVILHDNIEALGYHLASSFDFTQGSAKDRWLLVRRSVDLFKEEPWFGIGAGQWPITMLQFDQSGMLSADASTIYQRPHNDFFWVFSEYGVFAGLVFLLLAFVNGYKSVILFKKVTNDEHFAQMMFWIVFIAIQCTNYPLERPVFAMMFGLGLSFHQTNQKEDSTRTASVMLVGLIGMVALVLGLLMSRPQRAMFKSELTRHTGDWRQYQNQVNQAISLGLALDDRSRPLQWHLGKAAFEQGSLESAKSHFSKAIEQVLVHPEVLNSMGEVLEQSLEISGAEMYYEASIQAAPSYPKAGLNLAMLLYGEGRLQEAVEAYVAVSPNNDLPLYQPLGTRLAINRIEELVPEYDNRVLRKTAQAVKNTPEWSFQVIHHSAINNHAFEHQLLIEIFYYLLTQCEDEDCAEYEKLKQAYIPNQELNID